MARLIYTNSRGDSIELGQSAPFFVTKIDGFSDVENNISTIKSPNQDGESIANVNLEARYIVIQGEYYLEDRQEGRNKLIRTFNPKLNGTLKYISGDMVRTINCKPERTPIISSTNKSTVPYLVNLYCANPFWLDDFSLSEEITTWIGGISFPLKLPTRFSMAGQKIINIINKGDTETPIRIELQGPATNPKILKRATGEFIKVNAKVLEGEVLTITTAFGEKKVEINGENKFNYIDHESTFFNLEVGDNVIEASTDDETENTTFRIIYRNRYVGV